ncbi:hypothetical protein Tco_1293795 [Tanacetum coccineum]
MRPWWFLSRYTRHCRQSKKEHWNAFENKNQPSVIITDRELALMNAIEEKAAHDGRTVLFENENLERFDYLGRMLGLFMVTTVDERIVGGGLRAAQRLLDD